MSNYQYTTGPRIGEPKSPTGGMMQSPKKTFLWGYTYTFHISSNSHDINK
jgi:hypothetical protein